MTYRTRKRLALLLLVVGMPLYVVAAVTVVGWFDRPPFWAELLIYVGLGFLWAVPFRLVFRGIGQPDPDAAGPAKQNPAGGDRRG